MPSIKDRLVSAEEEFQTALLKGEDAVSLFNERWEALLEEVDAAFESTDLDIETSVLAHTTAIRIATLAEASIDLFTSNDAITAQFVTEVESLLSDVSLEGTSGRCPATPAPRCPTPLSIPVPPTRVGLKRPRDCGDGFPPPLTKRHRTSSTLQATILPTLETFTSHLPHIFPIPTPSQTEDANQANSPSSRKRNVSDVDTVAWPSGAKRLYVGPRLHAVSDTYAALRPLSRSSAPTDHSLGRLFPAEPVTVPDSSVPLNIQTVDLSMPHTSITPCSDVFAADGKCSSRSPPELASASTMPLTVDDFDALQPLLNACSYPPSISIHSKEPSLELVLDSIPDRGDASPIAEQASRSTSAASSPISTPSYPMTPTLSPQPALPSLIHEDALIPWSVPSLCGPSVVESSKLPSSHHDISLFLPSYHCDNEATLGWDTWFEPTDLCLFPVVPTYPDFGVTSSSVQEPFGPLSESAFLPSTAIEA